ncbi:MAG TPA: DUF4424 family protein [Caulobacteraceae bacterium]
MRGVTIAAALLGGLPGAALANDTSAVLSGAGLTLTASRDIVMQSEDLRLSPSEVRVAYGFRNRSARTVVTQVAFPLPEVDVGAMSETPHRFHFNGRDGDVVDFQLTVDGRPTAAALEARAFNDKGRDITASLARYRVPLIGRRSDAEIEAALGRLSPAAVKALAAIGAVYADEWASHSDIKHPGWKVRATYHWRQSFPAGAEVRIAHRYRPVLGGVNFDSAADLARSGAPREEGTWTDEKRGWCLSPALLTSVKTKGPVRLQWLEYVLRTGANWAGPISRFHLEITPPAGGLAASCAIAGLRLERRGGALVADQLAFTPRGDIAAAFLARAP